MITRDFLMRQIHQLVQALAQVMFHRQAGMKEEAMEVLENAVQDVTGVSLERLRGMNREELLALCGTGDGFSAEKAAALADLLHEEFDPEGRLRALWLYEAALEGGAPLPMDVLDRIADLRLDTK